MMGNTQIEAVVDRLYSLVDTGDHTASVIYDTLRWVQELEPEDPYAKYIGDEEGDE